MSSKYIVGILGANGFIGNRLVEWLYLNNHAIVRPVVRSYKSMVRSSRFELDVRLADATNKNSLQKEIEGCDVLFHCIVGDKNTILDSAKAAYTAASKAGVKRLVYLSTAVVHGLNPAKGITEESPFIMKKPFAGYDYGINKAKAENLLEKLKQDGKVEVVILRPSIVFGPRSLYWSANIAENILCGKAYLINEGRGICNAVYVDNLVQAMWLSAIKDNVANQAFFVTDEVEITWKDFYLSITNELGIDPGLIHYLSEFEIAEFSNNRQNVSSDFEKILKGIKQLNLVKNIAKIMPQGIVSVGKKLINKRLYSKVLDISGSPQLVIDQGMLQSQQCNYKLPIDKAKRILNYQPSICFKEAAYRTGEWLKFSLGLMQ